MKKTIILFLICIFLMGCSSDTTNLQNQINDLQAKNEELIKENAKLKTNLRDFIPEDTEEFKLLSTNSCYNANLGDSVETVKNIQGLEFVEDTTDMYGFRTIQFNGKFLSYDCEYSYGFEEDRLTSLLIMLTDKRLVSNIKNVLELNVNLWDLFNSAYGEIAYEGEIIGYENTKEFVKEWCYNNHRQEINFNYDVRFINLYFAEEFFDFNS